MITSSHNTQIKAARKLNQRRQRYDEGRLLLEGLRLVSDAWNSGAQPLQVFYDAEVRSQNREIATLLKELEEAGIASLACTTQVFASLTETVSPQGIAAVVDLPQLPLPTTLTLILLLDAVRDPGNAGTLLRSAEAAGVDFVLFAPGSVDAFNEKVLRAGMGVHFRLPLRVCDSWAEVKSFLPSAMPIYCAEATATLLYDHVSWQQPACLAIGNEATGIRDEVHQLAQPIAIPMCGQTESINAAMAGTIILFEAARQRRNAHLCEV